MLSEAETSLTIREHSCARRPVDTRLRNSERSFPFGYAQGRLATCAARRDYWMQRHVAAQDDRIDLTVAPFATASKASEFEVAAEYPQLNAKHSSHA